MLALSAALSLSLGAQSRNANWDNVSHLASGTEIRVSLAGGRMVRGFLQSTSPDTLAMNSATGQEMLMRTEVRRVQLKGEGHRGRNTLIGLAIGAGAGLGVGAAADAHNSSNWFPNFGKAVFTPIGAIIGTVVGVALPTGGWHDVYRAP